MVAENLKGPPELPGMFWVDNQQRYKKETEFKKKSVSPKTRLHFLFCYASDGFWAFHFILIVILKNNSNEIAESTGEIYREKQGATIIHYYETVNCKHQTGRPSLQRQIGSWKSLALLSLWFKIDWNAYIDGKAVRNRGMLIAHLSLLTKSFNGIPFRWARKKVGVGPALWECDWDLDTGDSPFLVDHTDCEHGEHICPSGRNQCICHIACIV